MATITLAFDKPINDPAHPLKVNDVVLMMVYVNGQAASGNVQVGFSNPAVMRSAMPTVPKLGEVALVAAQIGATDVIVFVGTDHSPIVHAVVAQAAPPPPPPPPKPTITIEPSVTRLAVGDSVSVVAKRNGVAATSGITWSASLNLKVVPLTQGSGQAMLTATSAGGASVNAVDTASAVAATMSISVDPAPPRVAPASGWTRLRLHICMMSTDFYYNWKKYISGGATPEEALYASRYDISMSGDAARHARMKTVNPHHAFIPYALQNSVLNQGSSLETGYELDYIAWCATNSVDALSAEMGWLHVPGGSTKDTRVHANIWDSPRDIPDPTSDVMRRYQIDRCKRAAAKNGANGLFFDEFGSNQMRDRYRPAAPTGSAIDTARLTAICDAETSLVQAIADAILPKQLIINSASYYFPWDAAMNKAARGTHQEQTNNPLVLELWSMWWPFIDTMLAAGVFTNMVPPYQFGEYESAHDDQTVPSLAARASRFTHHPVRSGAEVFVDDDEALPRKRSLISRLLATLGIGTPNYMDTPRGKLCELASYYMCVTTNPSLLALSIENGDWAKYTPTQNWMPAIDAEIGLPIEARRLLPQPTGVRGKCFSRRFGNGLVMINLIPDRGPRNYGASGATTLTLPTDRPYWRVMADGSLQAPRATVTLRCPEAAIFVCTAPASDLR